MTVEQAQFPFPKKFVDLLIPDPAIPEGSNAIFRQLKKVVIERALGANIAVHLDRAGRPRTTVERNA